MKTGLKNINKTQKCFQNRVDNDDNTNKFNLFYFIYLFTDVLNTFFIVYNLN